MTEQQKAAIEEAAKLPTAEETLQIAYDTIKANQSSEHKDVDPVLLHAIESHTEAHTEGLRDRVKELEAWKQSMSEVHSALNLQEVGKELDLKLGISISEQVLPGIVRLKAENKRYRQAIVEIERTLTNLQPHIPQACKPEHELFIDDYVDEALRVIDEALKQEEK